jgi:hypothetical protein
VQRKLLKGCLESTVRYDSICMNRGDPDIYIRGPVFISCNNVAPVTNLSIVCHNRKLRKAELF